MMKKPRTPGSSLRWSLGKDDVLLLTREGAREEIVARGRVFSAGPAELTAAVEEAQHHQRPIFKTVTLAGKWSVDARQRLSFRVERSDGKEDVLAFEGAWTAGPGNQITYRRPASGKSGFTIAGRWNFDEATGLSYVLETGDVLRVRGEIGPRSFRAKHGEFRWRLAAEGRRGRRLRELVLSGAWKAGRDLAVEFEAECEKGRKPVFRFGAVYALGRSNLAAHLTASSGRPLGVEVTFEKPFASGGAFARVSRSAREAIAETGLSFRW